MFSNINQQEKMEEKIKLCLFLSLKVQTWILMPKGRKSTASENELFYLANVNPQQRHGYFTCTKVGRSFYFCESFKCCLTFFTLKVREIGWFIIGDNLSSIVIKSIITFHSKLGTRFCLLSDKFDLCRIFDLDTCVSQWIGLSWERTQTHTASCEQTNSLSKAHCQVSTTCLVSEHHYLFLWQQSWPFPYTHIPVTKRNLNTDLPPRTDWMWLPSSENYLRQKDPTHCRIQAPLRD